MKAEYARRIMLKPLADRHIRRAAKQQDVTVTSSG
jgi:hypothetical protein